MMPAYRRTWQSFIFFGLFLVIGVFYIVPMALAIVNEAFWNATGKMVRRKVPPAETDSVQSPFLLARPQNPS
jgi:hypothetical protein